MSNLLTQICALRHSPPLSPFLAPLSNLTSLLSAKVHHCLLSISSLYSPSISAATYLHLLPCLPTLSVSIPSDSSAASLLVSPSVNGKYAGTFVIHLGVTFFQLRIIKVSLSLLFSVHISILPSACGNVRYHYQQPKQYCDVRAHAGGLSNSEVWFSAGWSVGRSVSQSNTELYAPHEWLGLAQARPN